MCQRSSPSSMPTWMPLRKLNTSSILRCSVSTCVCVLVCKLWLSVQVAAIAVCLSLPSYIPSLSLSPVQSPSTLFTSIFYHTLGLSHISFHITLLSPHNKLPLPYTLSHTSTLPSPYSFPHTILSSLSLYLFQYTTFPFPFLFPTVESVLHFSPAK